MKKVIAPLIVVGVLTLTASPAAANHQGPKPPPCRDHKCQAPAVVVQPTPNIQIVISATTISVFVDNVLVFTGSPTPGPGCEIQVTLPVNIGVNLDPVEVAGYIVSIKSSASSTTICLNQKK